MKRWRTALAALAAALTLGAAPDPEPATLIRGARVFDGSGAPAKVQDVLIRGERIAAVGTRLKAPGARVIDGRGQTLIPGLHDLHTHLRSPAVDAPEDLGKAYAGYLLHGVTSANDYSLSGEMIAPIREMVASGAVIAPRLQLAVRVGVPGGHGTEYGWGSFFTLQATTPRAARLAMRTALSYRPDLIKVFADGWRYGRGDDRNSMDQATLSAVVEEAHGAGIPVVTHTVTLAGAKIAAAAGVDALVHGIGDAPVDAELIGLMKARGTAYVPTLVVYEPQETRRLSPAAIAGLNAAEQAAEAAAVPGTPSALELRRWEIMQSNLRALHAAGVPIGVGTDAGIGGVYHGFSTVREIELLTQLGFTPGEALTAATRTSAAILGKGDRQGSIAAGMLADLVLVDGRPDERIANLHAVRRVFLGGRELPLARLKALRDGATPSPLPLHRMPAPIDTGTRDDGRTDLDTLPVEGSEAGADNSRLDVARVDGRLFALARMGAQPEPFALLTLPLTPGGVQLGDARGFTGIAMEVRGSGRHRLILDSYGLRPGAWFGAALAITGERRALRIPFTAFHSADADAVLDPGALRALTFRVEGPPGGSAWIEIGALRFY